MSNEEPNQQLEEVPEPEKTQQNTPPEDKETTPKNEENERATSPPRVGIERVPVLSPKSSGNRRPQSPGVYKGKLDIIKKFLVDQEKKWNKINSELSPLSQEKEALQKEWAEKQEQLNAVAFDNSANQQLQKQNEELQRKNADIAQQILALTKDKEFKTKTEKDLLTGRIQALSQELEQKQLQDAEQRRKSEQLLSEIKAQTIQKENAISNIDTHIGQKHQELRKVAENVKALEQQKKSAAKKIEDEQETKKQQEQRKNELSAKIEEARQRVNNKKKELAALKEKQIASGQHQALQNQISEAGKQGERLAGNIKKVEAEIAAKNKEVAAARDLEKKKEKRLQDLRRRLQETQRKRDDVKKEISKIELPDKKQKEKEYVPEELVTLKSQNEALRKEILKINQKIEQETEQMQRLVPPSVIDKMNKEIAAVIASNERYNEVKKIIEQVTVENQKLVHERERLEWGENNYLKELEVQRRKQEEKNKALEEELLTKKKTIQQLTTKIEQYSHAYPEFKPKKKPEPKEPKRDQKPKKTTSSVIASEGDRSPTNNPKTKQQVNTNVVEHIPRTASNLQRTEEPKKKSKKNKRSPDAPKEESKLQVVEEKSEPKVEPKVEAKVEPKIEPKVEPQVKGKPQVKEGESKRRNRKK